MTKQNNDNPPNSGELKNTQATKKTGEQMLIELGYIKSINIDEDETIYENKNANAKTIFFSNRHKDVVITNDQDEAVPITIDLHKAIHQCLLDFGWVEEEV